MTNVFYTLFVIALATADLSLKKVTTSSGPLRGKLITSYGGHFGYTFLGIPLAEPPVGDLRFKKPVHQKKWNETLDCFEYKPACVSNAVLTYTPKPPGPISEDCLYLNVFASNQCIEKGNCSVMVVVHGGAFMTKSPLMFDPEILTNNFANEERNIVLVTLPFRTGILGWFNISPRLKTSTDTNVPMRDLIFGLEWVKKEIHHFGGNPKHVTLYGHSGGGQFASLVSTSPLAYGLYHQLVIMSAPSHATGYTDATNREATRVSLKHYGCAKPNETFENEENVETIIQCARNQTWETILEAQESLSDNPEDIYGMWIDGEGGVFPEDHRILMEKRPKVNTLIGTVSGEQRNSIWSADSHGNAIPSRLKEMCTHVAYERNYEQPEAFIPACEAFYGRPNMSQMLCDDIEFYLFALDTANSLCEHTNVYVYSYTYRNPKFLKSPQRPYDNFGPRHSDELAYVLGTHRQEFKSIDYGIEKIMSGMVANFVKYGNPSYPSKKWTPWTKQEQNYFHIDFDSNLQMPGMKNGYYQETNLFWNNIAPRVAGKMRPLKDLPLHIDTYYHPLVQEALNTKWTNKSFALMKTVQGEMKVYRLWSEHLKYLQREHILLARDVKTGVSINSSSVAERTKNETSWTSGVLATVFCASIIVLVAVIGIQKMMKYRRRQKYENMT